ncbi:MAG: carboxy terminal-processing peptidase [Bacteroidetes bacterium]|nr:carboxy terminal-processing peptidase [Bacteroidota bacterium]MBU1115552.1 carboxy terminal-processing peptidase [Bacteroidota bacterium]MBU1797708.1 carboxy terminal-processing peptidase [Bacteroidota bacterium]
MKKIIILIFASIISIYSFAQTGEHFAENVGQIDTFKVFTPNKFHSKVDQIVTTLLMKYHYKKVDLNDSLSSVIFDNYLKSLDYNRVYFLQSDIDNFEKYRYLLDDFLKSGNISAPFDIFNVYKSRMNSRVNYIIKRMETEFDYTVNESFEPNRGKSAWAKSELELDEIWRKRLKNDALNKNLQKEEWEKTSKTLVDRYKRFHKIILQYKEEDLFQLYMNAFASAIDPHTNYFSPITSDNFDISMSLSFEGIGASLMAKDDYTTIARIIPGGPAAKSEKLFENDRIVGVAQGEDGEVIDIVGWRLDDVIQLIRGKKGTMVRLSILRADATLDMPTEEVRLVRDKIKLEEQAASSKIIKVEEEGRVFKLGVIDIPAFYIDFEAQRKGDPDYKSTTRDVKKLITELNKENVDGFIIDLRNDGGGSLQEAVELTGLFIEEGPVVQVKNSNGNIEVDEDPDKAIFTDKPLAVFINRYSASASEIFAGAIQDYGRGIILGEQSFGKGTVQNLIDLNRFMPTKEEELGKLKITIAKFYRINGSSTQKLGVIPEIEFPSIPRDEFGEASEPSALVWDQIETANFKKYGDLSSYFPTLISKHKKRIADNLEFQYLAEDIEDYKIHKEKTEYSLNKDIRQKERDENEAKKDTRENERVKSENLVIPEKDEVAKENLRVDDPLLEESGFILADLIIEQKAKK